MKDTDRTSSLDNLFTSAGDLKLTVRKSPFFTRPAYQYTSAEIGRQWSSTESEPLTEEPNCDKLSSR